MDFKRTDDAAVLCISCGKNKHQAATEMLIVGDGIAMCLKCLNLGAWCGNNLGKRRFRETEEGKNLPTPHEMKAFLDQYVIGQDEAKKTLSVAMYNHYKRVAQENGFMHTDIKVDKSNILMLGESGCGKTHTIKMFSKMLNVPFAIADISSYTASGYSGSSVAGLLSPLVNAGDSDKKKIENGIFIIDEVDKIAKKDISGGSDRDITGEAVQQELLKILEGDVVTVKDVHGHNISIDTTNILFVCIGSFAGIENIIRGKHCKGKAIGIGANIEGTKMSNNDVIQKITKEDLLEFGMIPEFLGRIPILAKLNTLNIDDLVRILKEPKNSIIDQFEYMFSLDGVTLTFEKEALEEIAKLSINQRAGARGLRGIVEELMRDIMFDIPSNETITEFNVTKEMVTGEIIEGEEQKTLSI